jgi:hypothetical protein
MATATVWKNVAIAMQSAIAAAKTITGITNASPGVATSASHGYSNGDYVILQVQGMLGLQDKVVRVASVATDTFALEGINTTDFGTFTSGTAEKLTFGTSITSATTMSSSDGGFDMIDTTTIHAANKSEIPGLPGSQSYTFENIWDPTDAGQIAMKTASDSQAKRAYKYTFGTGGKIMVFAGYVGFNGAPGGSSQQLVTTSAVITSQGSPTYYAS